MKKNGTIRDLTVGSPMKLVIGFAFPMLLGLLFQQFYSFVDAAIVGRALGAEALAAVGSTGSLNFMVIGLCTGMCTGFGIPISQSFGARREDELRRYLMNAVYISAVMSVVMGILTGILTPTMLRWMSTPEEILGNAVTYIQIIFFATPAIVLYNMSSAVMRSLGDSRTPVLFLALASVINIALDLLLIIGLHMGVAGAAVATVISQLVSGVGCVLTLMRKYPILRGDAEDRRFRKGYCLKLIGIGLPMGLQFSITAIGSVVLQSSVNILGTVYVAAMTAGGKVNMLLTPVFDALASAMATFAGQNVGARRIDRVRKGLGAASVIGLIYCALAYIGIRLFGRQALLLFVAAEETEVLKYAYQLMLAFVTFFAPLLFVNILRLTIQGMGYTALAICAGILEMVARTFVGSVMVPRFGFDAAVLASPCAWILADLFLFPACFIILSRTEKRMQSGKETRIL